MPDIDVPYFLARPRHAEPGGPGIVLVMEGGGISPQLLRVAQRFAREGYTVVAPDLFHRFGGSDPDAALAGQWFARIADRDAFADLAAAHATLRALGVGRIGITGFCMGGRMTYLAAVRGLDVAAAAPFYGSGISRLPGDVACPLLLFYGGNDEWCPSDEIARVRARHDEQVVVYPRAGHGFFRDGSPSYDADAAADAWRRLLGFFGEHVGTEAVTRR